MCADTCMHQADRLMEANDTLIGFSPFASVFVCQNLHWKGRQ